MMLVRRNRDFVYTEANGSWQDRQKCHVILSDNQRFSKKLGLLVTVIFFITRDQEKNCPDPSRTIKKESSVWVCPFELRTRIRRPHFSVEK